MHIECWSYLEWMLVVVAISNCTLCFLYLIIIDYKMDSGYIWWIYTCIFLILLSLETRAYTFLVVVIGACTKRIELVSSFIPLLRLTSSWSFLDNSDLTSREFRPNRLAFEGMKAVGSIDPICICCLNKLGLRVFIFS